MVTHCHHLQQVKEVPKLVDDFFNPFINLCQEGYVYAGIGLFVC